MKFTPDALSLTESDTNEPALSFCQDRAVCYVNVSEIEMRNMRGRLLTVCPPGGRNYEILMAAVDV